MSNKYNNPALFCETQLTDPDEEDYIDLLIRQKGSQALNELLKDSSNTENPNCEESEIVLLRD